MKRIVSITIEPETLALIDKARGLVKRSNFVEEILKKALGLAEVSERERDARGS